MVRLEAHSEYHYIPIRKFQFHYGTIRSNSFGISGKINTLFQFHYGTIRSPASLSSSALIVDFNSTMVRLEVLILQ